MKANELQINNFLQAPDVQFVIPVYQRNYGWKNAECNELLYDIINVETKKRGTHFIESILFIHEGTYSTNEVKELVIMDGQQRLTIINIWEGWQLFNPKGVIPSDGEGSFYAENFNINIFFDKNQD